MATQKTPPKHPIKSRTNQFNLVTLVLYPVLLALLRALFDYLQLSYDNQLIEQLALGLIAAVPVVLANLRLRSATNTPVGAWLKRSPQPE